MSFYLGDVGRVGRVILERGTLSERTFLGGTFQGFSINKVTYPSVVTTLCSL